MPAFFLLDNASVGIINDGYIYRERVNKARAGLDVLSYYSLCHRHSSSEVWAERLKNGEIELNGRIAGPADVLASGDQLAWHRPPWTEETVPLHAPVLYEDDDLLALHKPAGLPTMPAGGFLQNTLWWRVTQNVPEAAPLHRLGRGTSGVVLFAKTHAARSALLADWRSGKVEKHYLALAEGRCEAEELTLKTTIGPVEHPRLGSVFAASENGKSALSMAKIIKREAQKTLFSVEIFTGRPHQIRIHLATAGFPLLNDPLYAAGGGLRSDALPSDIGYPLHAHRLIFRHPSSAARLEIVAPAPDWASTMQP